MALPLSGWCWSSVADKPILVAGLFNLSPLVAPNPDLYDLAKLVHSWTAWFCGALIGGHVLVALKHHFVDKDDILKGTPQTQELSGVRELVGNSGADTAHTICSSTTMKVPRRRGNWGGNVFKNRWASN